MAENSDCRDYPLLQFQTPLSLNDRKKCFGLPSVSPALSLTALSPCPTPSSGTREVPSPSTPMSVTLAPVTSSSFETLKATSMYVSFPSDSRVFVIQNPSGPSCLLSFVYESRPRCRASPRDPDVHSLSLRHVGAGQRHKGLIVPSRLT